MLNKFSLAVGSLFSMFVLACSNENVAGGTIDPNSIAEKSSSSADIDVNLSSSSDIEDKPDLSSSSVGNKGIILSSSSKGVYGPLFPENFSMQCVDDDAGSPAASMRVDGDSIRVSLMNASFRIPCDKQKREEFIKSVNERGPIIGIENDTIYVNFTRSKGMVYDCNCAAKASFSLDKIYSDFTYMLFDQEQTIFVQEQ